MKKKKIRFWYWSFKVLAYIGLFSPLLILIIMNWNKYFVSNKAGLSVGTGGVMAILIGVLLVKVGFKKFNKVFWSTAFLLCVYCLNSVIQDALPITFTFWLGTLIFFIFEMPMNHFKKLLNIYVDEETRVVARDETNKKSQKDYNVIGR